MSAAEARAAVALLKGLRAAGARARGRARFNCSPAWGGALAQGVVTLPLSHLSLSTRPGAGHPLRMGKMTLPLSHKSCDGAHLQGPPYAGVMLRVCDTNAHLQGTPSVGVELRVVCRRT